MAVRSKISEVRSKLEYWLNAELRQQGVTVTSEIDNFYYGSGSRSDYQNEEDKLAAIDRIRGILATSYPDCKPLRDLLKCLDAARNLLVGNRTK